ncbi:glycogen operon protein GlgX [Lachnospiraceae bacterium]|nr:glycogen operon protein GlgX [Lachnospiraceae bacterium]
MKTDWKISYFRPDRQGVYPSKDSVSFAACLLTDKECGVILYDSRGRQRRFPFKEEGKRGALHGLRIEGEGVHNYTYNYYVDDQIITDTYAREVRGLEKWGAKGTRKRTTYGVLACYDFDWQEDAPLMTPLADSIFYGLNVRAFTMHKSSGVKERGTFEGIIEKIPYLKSLGITAVELMPCYEYDECMVQETNYPQISLPKGTDYLPVRIIKEAAPDFAAEAEKRKLNCWGFEKGFYFAPKSAYCKEKPPVISFKTMVRELHKNGIEVIMQFYFPPEIRQLYMLDVIKHWVMEYHIDGVRISGFHIPFRLLAEEPVLRNTKIWCSYLPNEDFPVISNPIFKNFISDNGNYRNDIRRFLKGDEGLLSQALGYHRCNPKEHGVVNYLADYDGFTLYDCVSYERKHNEANGEDNRDGADVNFTWNCGVEGDTRKKSIMDLRMKQIKNALSFVFLSQGIPFIYSGDEFASSRKGNNNCYCQDNETGWVNWKDNQFSREILAYTQFLIRLRKEHPILHMKDELLVMDSKGCGCPDISYHGIEAWRPDFGHISRMIGIVLCGQYAPGEEDASFYIACNMHWESHKLALPKLSRDEKWVKISDTSLSVDALPQNEWENRQEEGDDHVVTADCRSISVYMSKKYKETKSGKKERRSPARSQGKKDKSKER